MFVPANKEAYGYGGHPSMGEYMWTQRDQETIHCISLAAATASVQSGLYCWDFRLGDRYPCSFVRIQEGIENKRTNGIDELSGLLQLE